MTKHPIRRPASIVAAGVALVGASAGTTVASATASASYHARATKSMNVLRGDGIGHARFGETPKVATKHLEVLLGRSPAKSYRRINACGLDHATTWRGLIVFFRHGRFVGYTYSAHASKTLATTSGLRVGNTLARGRQLYGHSLRTTLAQGGAYRVTTSSGKLEGFVSHAPPVTSRSTVRTIEAGDVGCSAVTP